MAVWPKCRKPNNVGLKMQLVKTANKLLGRLGYVVRRLKPYGNYAADDLKKIFGPKPIQTVFDVGANEGQAARMFLEDFPAATIYSFEPFPKAYAKIKEQSGDPRLIPVNMALGETTMRKKLFLTKYSLTNSLLPVDAQAKQFLGECVDSDGETVIDMTTLDAFCAERKIPRIDLLKLDTQGYELNVLEGAQSMLASGSIKAIFTEVNFVPLYEKQAYFHQVYQRLWDQGFRLVSFYDQEYRAGTCLNWCDALFVKEGQV